ncbi:redoxin domain-containing protein [Nonomuraea sp. NPDC050310]|uniref:TlpA family protein disulfide reductase n=1 Tax=Nonomuraea sp. NPDC050310 TaxID=3154935 RepID=UPI0033C5E6DE
MVRARAATAALTAAFLLVSGCGGGEWDDAAAPLDTRAPLSAPTTPAAVSASAVPTPVVPAALRFTARTLDGRPFDGAGLAGRPVVFWFWAPWCPKCRAEAPAVKAVAAEYGEAAFVGVAGLDTEAAMKEFVQRTGTGSIVQLADPKGAVWTKLGVSSQSTFVFLRPDGSTTKATGPLGEAELAGHVRKLTG